jgi:hypothetical protein
MLRTLVTDGKCDSVEFLDLYALLKSCRKALGARVDASLKKAADKKLGELRDLFEVTGDPLMEVPAEESKLFLGSTEPSRLEQVVPSQRRNVRELLRSRSDAKFTLLIGNFGTGKTTAGLLAASAGDEGGPTIIFAECAYFMLDRLASGLSVLLEEALKDADAFSELPMRNQELFHLASPLLREELGNRGNKLSDPHKYILLLDGVDENRLYARPEGMAILINSLADIHCPIVLTTRREHFISTFENMKTRKLEFGEKHGFKKPIRVFSLEPWGREDIQRFVAGSVDVLNQRGKPDEAAKLADFLRGLQSGSEREFYGDLSAHPLFLRLILDDVAVHGVRKMGRANLIWEWSLYKIKRDIERKAQIAGQGWTFESNFAERIMRLMEEVAFKMTSFEEGKISRLSRILSGLLCGAP